MLTKLIVILMMLGIVASLASGLVFLVRDNQNTSRRVVKALSFRIGLSLILFCLLIIAFAMGWIQPHGIGH